MAQNAVSFFSDRLLLPLMEVGKKMTMGVLKEVEVEDMRDEIEKIQAFIYDADRSLAAAEEDDTKDEIKKQKQLIEEAFRMEDVMDDYKIWEERHPCDLGCAAFSCQVADFIKTMILRHQIQSNYHDFQSRVREIQEIIGERPLSQTQSFSEQRPSSSTANQNVELLRNIAPLYMDEDEVVGFEAPVAKLIGWLVDGREQRTVISVVGMGGQGKTTLAKKVFDNKNVIRHFDCRAWVTVSQSYTVEGLLRDMLLRFYTQSGGYPPKDIFRMDRRSLLHEVRNYLWQKRYIIVFDDVWNVHFWDEIEFVVTDNKNGSRIFITTRSMNVAMWCKNFSFVEVHELQPLTEEQSLELFIRKAFRFDFDGYCPEEFIGISYEIVNKCKGLPLAILAIAGLLAVKERNVFEWKRFSKNLSSQLKKDGHLRYLPNVLSLGYHNLPSFLKPCLLYFAIYPEAYEVKTKRLIRQWIAEGFVKQESGRTLEKVAEGYLTELINRSLVQVSSVSIDGKAKGCFVHDLIRALIQGKAEELSFCQIFSEGDWRVLSEMIRRLSIATTPNDLMASIENTHHVRSLFFFTEEEFPKDLVRRISTKFKLLKVLDFESARSFDVPENLGDLILLRYLSFRKTGVQTLPKSLGNLQNLETLDLRQTAVNEMPKEISKLRKLRHLLGNKMCSSHLKDGIGEMTFLQTLSEVRVDEDGTELFSELGKLKLLRKLSLFDVRKGQETALCCSINEMQHLEKLYIDTTPKDAAIDLSLVSCPATLQKLRLQAKLNMLPGWIPEVHNLIELSLSHSQLAEDPLKSLENLPNLLVLNLGVHSYEGECLHFHGGFLKLKELGLRYLNGLSSIVIDKGALCSLKEITFMNIPNLKTAPSGIFHLQKLEVLNTYFMSTEFEHSIAPLTKLVKDKKFGK